MKHVVFISLFSVFVTITLALVLLTPLTTFERNSPPEAATTTPDTALRSVVLFHYQPEADMDTSGNIQCSPAGLVGIFREIPQTQTLLTDTLELLLQGELTDRERQMGITTEFPLADVMLVGVSLRDGVAIIALDDPDSQTSGGTCRANVLRAQITRTALQFPAVEAVRFLPETLFQP